MSRILARAPVRVDPAGGGTDAPPFSVEHGGLVVNFAVGRYAYASVERLPPGSGVTIFADDLGTGVTAPSSDALPVGRLDLLCGFVKRLVPPGESVLLVTESDAPAGAGLGGSGALGVAVVAALDRAFDGGRSPGAIARLANRVERVDLGYPGGDQDSFAATLGGFNLLEYPAGGSLVAHRLCVPEEARLALEHDSLLIYTSEAHVSGNIHEDIKRSYAEENSPTVAAMVGLREAAREMAPALEAGDLATYARCLATSCREFYNLHPSCDCEAHRELFRHLDGLILGGKTCGAGGGGFVLVLARPGQRRACIAKAEGLGAEVWPVAVDFEGVKTWSAPPTPTSEVELYCRRATGA